MFEFVHLFLHDAFVFGMTIFATAFLVGAYKLYPRDSAWGNLK